MKLNLFIFLIFQINYSLAQEFKSFKLQTSFYKFNLDKKQGGISKFIDYDDKRKVFIRAVERPSPAIETFSIETGNMVAVTNLKLQKIGAFKAISANRLWIHDRLTRNYLLINQKGEILSKIKEPDFSCDLTYILSSSFPSAPIITYKDAIYVTGIILFKPQKNFDIKVYKKTGVIEKLSLKGSSTFIGAPSALSLNNFYGNLNAYSLTLKQNLLIAAPFFSDEIQIINLDNFSKKNLTLKTKYGSLIQPLARNAFEREITNFEKNQIAKKSYANIGMVYDKYKDVYYRFVHFPEKPQSTTRYGIIVFDKNFKPFFETKINSNIYNIGMYFITEKGLAIFNRKKYIADNTKLTFDVFSLK